MASAAPRSPYRHLELCGIAINSKTDRRGEQHRLCGRFGFGVKCTRRVCGG
ncbi:MAG: hypothetical protein WAW66_07200 [Gemmiger qucibialis]